MHTVCLMSEYLYDLNSEVEAFSYQNDVVKVIYRIYPEFCVAEIEYRL